MQSFRVEAGSVETLALQELPATNDNLGFGYQISIWRTREHLEIFLFFTKSADSTRSK